MIQISPTLSIDENDIQFEFIRASGPGGQNVNKVASAVQLRFNTDSLPDEIQQRLLKLAGKRINEQGTLIIEAKRYRRQEKNREDARNRLVDLLHKAAKQPKPRKKTKPSAAAKKRRLASKRRRSELKRRRQPVDSTNE